MRDEQQRLWAESWAGWKVTPPGVPSGSGYNALHKQSGGFGRLSAPDPPWMDRIPHRFWDDSEVQAQADAWGPRWHDEWADDDGAVW
ncbi:MAG: hypothetical protein R2761_24530 [Acidimicrobiales bacterium]